MTATLSEPRTGTRTVTAPARRDTAPSRRPSTTARPAAGPTTATRPATTGDTRGTAPFVLLIMVLLTGGLVATLWLSTAAAADSYRLDEARQVARDLSEQSERLHRDVEAAQSAPALAAAARAQGMVPAGEPAVLLVAPDGTTQVIGDPRPAEAIAPPPAPAAPVPPVATNNGAQAATDGRPAPAPAGAAAAEDQLVAVPDTTPDAAAAATTPDAASAAEAPATGDAADGAADDAADGAADAPPADDAAAASTAGD
ncbi:hypothetical protein [Actinomycetospora cinnamomea]|uniref:Uncharacterized protein n=1 Tax=Actinomycetospora cinnamomea TaxID=663609 RepID=A0A2U1F9T2_9PSEU|nr:hypothetical protein [Actinomycetospora cinnamomea]PVZ08924.1 hypothetical protein C8D89_10786 [Actinomycetospora cinnamomea]